MTDTGDPHSPDLPPVIVAPATVVPPVSPAAAEAKVEIAKVTTAAHIESTTLTEAGQRRINFIWEATQSGIAFAVVLSNLGTGVLFAIRGTPISDFPPILSHSMFLVIGFYFSRTNHAAIGGAGAKPAMSPYEGR